MTPSSYYGDLVRAYHVCLERVSSMPEGIYSASLFSGLNRIMDIAKDISRRTPDRFSRRGDVIFMTMALPILVSVAVGETVELSSVEGCIQAYTDSPRDKPMSLPAEGKETQYCRLRGDPVLQAPGRPLRPLRRPVSYLPQLSRIGLDLV